MRLFFGALLLLFYTNTTFSQIEKDTLVAYQYYQKADSLLAESKFKKSLEFTNKALPIYKRYKIWDKVAASNNNISFAYWKSHQHEKSLIYSKRAWDICNSYLSENHKERGITLVNIAQYYFQTSNHEKSIHYLEKALDIFKKIKPYPEKNIAHVYGNLANDYTQLSQYHTSLKYHLKGLRLAEKIYSPHSIEIGIKYFNLGLAYINLGKTLEGIDAYQLFHEIVICNYDKNHLYVAFAKLNKGVANLAINKTEQALLDFFEAEPIFKRENNNYGLLKTYYAIGNVYTQIGQYDKAISFYETSTSIAKKTYGAESTHVGYNFMSTGNAYANKGESKKAFFYLKNALDIYKKKYSRNDYMIALISHSIGDLYAKEDPEKALKHHLTALKIQKKLNNEDYINVSNSYSSIASHYVENKKYQKAIEYETKSLNIISNSYGKNHMKAINSYLTLGLSHKELNNISLAITSFNNSLKSNRKNLKPDAAFTPNDYWDQISLLETLNNKGIIYKDLYKQKNDSLYFHKAFECFIQAKKTISSIHQSYQRYEDKIRFLKEARETYSNAIELTTLLQKKNIHKMFSFFEESKSNTLKELLSKNEVIETSNYMVKIIKDLKTRKAYFISQIMQQQSEKKIDSLYIMDLKNKLFNTNQKIDSINITIQKNHPKYHKLKYQNKTISVEKVQQKLTKEQTLLEFFSADSITYAFIISKNNIAFKELPTSALEEQITALRKANSSKDVSQYKRVAQELHTVLIKPIKEELVSKELIIVPDGPLWHLNFDLLLTEGTASMNPANFPYLLKDYAISYANSATLLFQPFEEQYVDKTQEGCLAFSFSDSTNIATTKNMSLATLRDTGDDLPGTRKEIKAISEIVDGQYFFGSDASEATFKKNASNYKILHLALHGDVDNERPENSKLYFTKTNDTIEDNYLYSHELFALNIPAELTVLSACNTGTGKIAKGEGIMSLGNAFQYAGTKSLLLSSWEVPDETTPELMQNFYRNLKEGMNKSKALQQAKLQFLQQADVRKTNPFYWGGFYLVGDPAPIDLGRTPWWYWVLGIGLLLTVLLLYFRRKARS